MLGWLKRIFNKILCEHEYELIREYDLLTTQGVKYGKVRAFECVKCRKQKINKFVHKY